MTTFLAALLLLSGAFASEDACLDCCRSRGLVSCPTRVRVMGDGSLATREGSAWRVIGIWWVDCDGSATFEPGQTVVLDHVPEAGEILRLAYPPTTVRCFEEHCARPAGSCIREGANQSFYLERCTDHEPLSAVEMRIRGTAPSGPVQAVRVGNRTIMATPVQGPTAPSAVVLPGGRTAPASPAAPQSPAAPTRAAATPAPPPDLALELPPPPKGDCTNVDALIAESRRHSDRGDEARVAAAWTTAIDEYSAAITLDGCNASAWSGLGELALLARHGDDAVKALKIATRLQPLHYGALTALGEAYARQGRTDLARQAFQAALDVEPNHEPARAGLEGLR